MIVFCGQFYDDSHLMLIIKLSFLKFQGIKMLVFDFFIILKDHIHVTNAPCAQVCYNTKLSQNKGLIYTFHYPKYLIVTYLCSYIILHWYLNFCNKLDYEKNRKHGLLKNVSNMETYLCYFIDCTCILSISMKNGEVIYEIDIFILLY